MEQPIYQGITANYNVEEVCNNWFDKFHELEKGDVWGKMTDVEKEYVKKVEDDRIMGRVDPSERGYTRAFDDVTDHTNIGFIPQQLKILSQTKTPPSENSMSSGSGNYEEEAAKDDLSDDSDLAYLKTLRKDRAVKQ